MIHWHTVHCEYYTVLQHTYSKVDEKKEEKPKNQQFITIPYRARKEACEKC